jgi:hypothetical protein
MPLADQHISPFCIDRGMHGGELVNPGLCGHTPSEDDARVAPRNDDGGNVR